MFAIDHVDGRIVSDECQHGAGQIERTRVNPAMIERAKLGHTLGGFYLCGPCVGLGRGTVHALYVGAEQATLEVGSARGYDGIARMPVQTQRGGFDLFLDVFAHPKALVLFVVAHAYASIAATDGELFLVRAPFGACGRSIDSQHDQFGLPRLAVVAPHVGVAIRAARHYAIRLRRPVDAQHFRRMLIQRLI